MISDFLEEEALQVGKMAEESGEEREGLQGEGMPCKGVDGAERAWGAVGEPNITAISNRGERLLSPELSPSVIKCVCLPG